VETGGARDVRALGHTGHAGEDETMRLDQAARSVFLKEFVSAGDALLLQAEGDAELSVREGACPWRIRKSSHKRIGQGSLVRYRHRATVRIDAAPAHTRRPPDGHHRQTRTPGRSTRRRGRILVAEAPVAHQ
jgi:hypothetical protein